MEVGLRLFSDKTTIFQVQENNPSQALRNRRPIVLFVQSGEYYPPNDITISFSLGARRIAMAQQKGVLRLSDCPI